MKNILILLLLSAVNLNAIVTWEKIHPSFGEFIVEVNCISVFNSDLYFGINGKGVYKSSASDQNSVWMQFPPNITPASIDEILSDKDGNLAVSIGRGNKVAYKSASANSQWIEIYAKKSSSKKSFPLMSEDGKIIIADSTLVFSLDKNKGFNLNVISIVPTEIIGLNKNLDYLFVFTEGKLFKFGKDSIEVPFPFSQIDYSIICGNGDLYAGVKRRGLFRLKKDAMIWDTVFYAGKDSLLLNGFVRIKEGKNGELFVCTTRGLFASFDGGSKWNDICNLASRCNIRDVVNYEGKLIITDYYDGIFESSDMGQNWTHKFQDRKIDSIYKIWLDRFDNIYLCGNNNNLFRSIDGAKSFSNIFIGLPKSEIKDFIDLPDTSVIISIKDEGLYFKSAYSNVWGMSSNGLPYYVNDLFMPDEETLLAGTIGGGVYRSLDNGQSWRRSKLDSSFYNVTAFYSDGKDVFANIESYGIARSTDLGLSWNLVDTDTSVKGIRELLFIDGSLYSIAPGGMFKKVNGIWEAQERDDKQIFPTDILGINSKIFFSEPTLGVGSRLSSSPDWDSHEGMSAAHVSCLAPASNFILYAGSLGDGLFRTKSPVISVADESKNKSKTELFRVSGSEYILKLNNKSTELQQLRLVDILGQTIDIDFNAAGNHSYSIHPGNVCPGVYILLIISNKGIESMPINIY